MLRFVSEGEKIKQGLNFYRLNDRYNFGVKILIYKFALMIRYSKSVKKWFIVRWKENVDKN